MVPIFVFWNVAFKVYNTAWIMPIFYSFLFIPFTQWFPIFVFWNFAFKVYNTAWIMPCFCNFLHPFSSVVFKLNIQLIWKMMFTHFSDYLYVT